VYYINYSFNVGIARLILIPILRTYLIVWLEQAVQMHLEDLYRDQRIVLSLVVHIHVYLVHGYCSYCIIFRFVFYHWDLDCIFLILLLVVTMMIEGCCLVASHRMVMAPSLPHQWPA